MDQNTEHPLTRHTEHPLTRLISWYCGEYERSKEDNLDLSPMDFHRKCGLSIQCPHSWRIVDSIKCVLDSFEVERSVVIIFSSTIAYKELHTILGDSVQYFSWHEVFTGMHIARTDVRYINRVKTLLSQADITFFIDPPAIPEVVDQVRGQAVNALVLLSGSGINE